MVKSAKSLRAAGWLLLLLIAFAVRTYRLDAQSIWVDEGISLHLATSGLAEIVVNRAANIHPPLYFILLKGWVALTGGNLFTARFFSLLVGMVQTPAIYAIARRLSLGRAAAWSAAIWSALSPAAVIYAQEARVYALLPPVYLALLALLHALTTRPIRPSIWLLLAVSELLALHLHYAAIFPVAYVACASFLALWRGNRASLRPWFVTHLLVGLGCLPWLAMVVAHRAGAAAEATLGTALVESPSAAFLLNQIWNFYLTGLTGVENRPLIQMATWGALALCLAALAVRLARPGRRAVALRLLADWGLPMGGAMLLLSARPFSHPRYLLMFAPGLLLLIAHLASDKAVPRLLRVLLWVAMLLPSFLGLQAYFYDPAFQKDDVRGVARYLEQILGPDDLILAPAGDWSLEFVYRGPAAVVAPPSVKETADVDALWPELARWTARPRRIAVVDYRRELRDWPQVVFFALEGAGEKVVREDFKGLLVHIYAVTGPASPPAMRPATARFGPLRLTHTWVEATAHTATALTLACRWQMDVPAAHRYGLTVRLLDADGWPLMAQNDLLLDEQLRPTDGWTPGVPVVTYHILPIPPGAPPLTYTVDVGVYAQSGAAGDPARPESLLDEQGAPQGQWLPLSTVRLTAAPAATANAYRVSAAPPPLAQPYRFSPNLTLLGARLDRAELAPGQSLFVVLHWQATSAPLPDLRPRVALRRADSGAELTADESAPALGRYPTDRWQAGETVLEHHRLSLPAAVGAGEAEVVVTLGDESLTLGLISISDVAHTFAPPPLAYPLDVRFGQVARLIGYDLTQPTTRAITVTLYWEAGEGAAENNYTVFTHILAADGRMVGGHDAPPAAGVRPTSGWLPGEIIADTHPMVLHEPYSGPARIEIGLYDPATIERVAVDSGNTFFILPVELTIPPAPLIQ